jgi:hypothetical protein
VTDYSRIVSDLDAGGKQALSNMLGKAQPIWLPQAGPQTSALQSEADVLFYGGSAGGGKTDLLIGLAFQYHVNSLIMRREGTQFRGIVRRCTEMLGSRDGYTAAPSKQWRYEDKTVEFGSCPHLGDEQVHQGIPHDLLGFDEITHFLEFQFRFLTTWLRSATPGQRCRVVAAGNPPTTSDGSWVREYWGPWLDPLCPVQAEPGDLLWYATNPDTGEDTLVESSEPIMMGGELVLPMSRTFIPSSVDDNAFLLTTGYKRQLQSLPEPLRSQMLHGDFSAGLDDNAWQVIPSAAVRAATERWSRPEQLAKMTAMGVDVARGGRDNTILSPRHGDWYDELKKFPGASTPTGQSVVALIVQYQRDRASVAIDSIGVGSSVVDHMQGNKANVVPINGSASADGAVDVTNSFGFVNLRSKLHWQFREALVDPQRRVSLPPDPELIADLCAPRYTVVGGKIKVESKDDIIKRIGRSPDCGDAVIYASAEETDNQMFLDGDYVDFDTPIDYTKHDRGVI